MPLPSLSLLLTAFVFLLFHPFKVTAAYNKEHRKECLEWYMKYGVEPGNTWGTIPDELQSVWRANDCDSLLYAQEDEDYSSEFGNHLMLLMPGEGIAAQLNQLGSVWRGAQHRQIVLTPVESHHYPGDELVLCDWFTFPAPFDCNYQRKTRQEWKKTLRGKCMRSNYLPQGVSFNMKMYDKSCIEGPLPYGSNTWYNWGFSDKAKELFKQAKELLGIQGRHISFHWRRGDQLTDRERCGKSDHSTNCGNVTRYMKHVNAKLRKYVTPLLAKDTKLPVYIATNEANTTILEYIHQTGYLTPLSLTKAFAEKNIPLKPSMIAVIDVMMMCTSFMEFHNPGTSGLYGIIETCRNRLLML